MASVNRNLTPWTNMDPETARNVVKNREIENDVKKIQAELDKMKSDQKRYKETNKKIIDVLKKTG